MEKYIKQKVIGKGSYGQAVVVKRKSDGALLVMKEVKLQGLKLEERKEARAECELLSRLRHPNIIQYIEHFEQRQVLYIVMEYAEKGDMDGMLKKHKERARTAGSGKGLPQDQALHYFAQICMAMRYLHDKKILHRDIKCANIFLTANNVVKIGDFGISTILRNTFALARTVCGTPYYFSPELCQSRPYNNKSDVWAIGCVLYELLTLRHPFDGTNMKQLMQRIIKSNPAAISAAYDRELRDLVTNMLAKNDKVRPNVGQVLATPIMRQALEKLQAGLGMATLKRDKLPNFQELLNKNALVHPQPQPQVEKQQQQVRAGQRPRPSEVNVRHPARGQMAPNRLSPKANDVDLVKGKRNDVHPNALKREREKKLEAQMAEKAKDIARWHHNEQIKKGIVPTRQDELNPKNARGNPGHRRRVSAPTSPNKGNDLLPEGWQDNKKAQASPRPGARGQAMALPNLDLEPQYGRRKGQASPKNAGAEKEKERERQYEQVQKEKRMAVNNLLLNDMPSKDDKYLSDGSRPSSEAVSPSHIVAKVGSSDEGKVPPIMHGRRATEGNIQVEEEMAGQSQFVPTEDDTADTPDTDSSDEPDSENDKNRRMEEYKEMIDDIDKALTKKPGVEEDFGEEVDCPPALAPSKVADPPKFTLAGATLRLDVAPTAPLSQRAEVLRHFIDAQLGTELFLKAYKLISESKVNEKVLQSVEVLLGDSQKEMGALIIQLVYSDDQVNLNQN
eukprot:TRINITY_DN4130_c0_g4_i1.p1 TRINITY_DN4130_c0_g4~~TRINITY_DN4130_c0_g4_i1.p1  ORF type:complete len:751 (+),score=204.76 TRINITY_DN4130_c0_g4_i1:59-2254(+)